MSVASPPGSRTLAFGSLDPLRWGAAWLLAPALRSFGVLGAGELATAFEPTVTGADESDDWLLEGDGAELTASPAGPPAALAEPAAGFDQLCRVRGRITIGGIAHEVDCLGRRGARAEPIELGRLESLREVSAWFEPDSGLAVSSRRPRKARGHDADLIAASVLETPTPIVADPRLSTTYSPDGQPARAGLELWFVEDAEADEEAGEHPFPRRAAGEAAGAGVSAAVDGIELSARPFIWHSRGVDGAGVYLLARRR